ncbi:MAG: DUF378 domain-containing protein [SAR202 cluster bacterium]|nr:DUF378 domain-containing protein [SAR202 cluster bacterium]
MEAIKIVSIILAAVGAINWGLVALFKFDLVAFIAGRQAFGSINTISRIVYLLVAVAGVIAVITSLS